MKPGRRDANEPEIVSALTAIGATVDRVERRPYDLVVGYRGHNYLLEVKTHRGKLKSSQIALQAAWRGQYAVVRSAQEAIAVVGDPR